MPKFKLLIAEDSKAMQVFYQKEINDSLFEKKIVGDGEQALLAYRDWQPDIILLDLNMPIVNGYQTLKAIRETANDATTTVIMVTSASEKDDVIACAKLGINGYIVKPFKADILNQSILKYHQDKK